VYVSAADNEACLTHRVFILDPVFKSVLLWNGLVSFSHLDWAVLLSSATLRSEHMTLISRFFEYLNVCEQ